MRSLVSCGLIFTACVEVQQLGGHLADEAAPSLPTPTADAGAAEEAGVAAGPVEAGAADCDGPCGAPERPSCTSLGRCCVTLPSNRRATCEASAKAGFEPSCAHVLASYAGEGYCTGNPGGLSNACEALSRCCRSHGAVPPPAEGLPTCEQTVQANEGSGCMQYLRGTCPLDSTDGGLSRSCAETAACCTKVPPNLEFYCNSYAATYDDGACEAVTASHVRAGHCP